MIRTKDLIEFVKKDYDLFDTFELELAEEIVARLRAFDKLKEGIEKMIRDCHDPSNKVDK